MKSILAGLVGRPLLALGALFLSSAACAVDVQVSSFTDSPDPAVRGGNISFTITVENSDADTANNVVASYALPANTQFVSVNDPAVPGACSHDGLVPGTVTCTYPTLLGTLAAPTPGPVRTITVVLRTTGATVTTLASTVTVTTSDSDSNLGNNTLSQNTTINNGADLSATMVGAPDPVVGGALVTWTVSGSNIGPNSSGAISFTTTLPGVLTYVVAGSGGTGWTCPASVVTVVTCTRAIQAVGAYPNLAIVTRLTGVASGTVTLSGNITSTVGDPDLSNNSPVASVGVSPGADLAVTQSPPSPATVVNGAAVTFALQPSNAGPNAASAGANVSFPLPAGFAVTSATGSAGWACASAGSPVIVTCTFAGSLASGASGTLTILATAPTVATPTNFTGITATIAPNSGGPVDPNAANNTAVRSVIVSPDGVDLSATKSKTPSFVALGANMTSTIVVKNTGPRTAASGTITLVDALDPTKEQYVSFSGTSWACVSAPPNVNCTYNTTLGIANANTLTITTKALAAGTATNNATASYSGSPGDFNAANDTIAASVTITAANNSPDLQVALSAATAGGVQTTVEATETVITYTATLTNKLATAADASNVVVTLSIPGRSVSTNVLVTAQTLIDNSGGLSNASFTCAGTGSGSVANVVCTQTGGTVLSAGDAYVFTVTANRPMTAVTNVNATLSAVSTTQGDPLPGDNSTTLAITVDPIADVEVVSKILAANPVLAGTNATYTITLRNNGPSSAASVSMADVFTIPGADSGFTFISAVASNAGVCSGLVAGTSYASGTPTINCAWPGSMANAAVWTVTVVVRPNWQAGAGARTLANTATISTSTAEDSVGGQGAAANSKSLTLNINPAQVDMLINNTDSPDPLGYDSVTASNNDITYTVATTNTGPSLASGTGFSFTMTPPAGKTMTFRGDGSAAGVAAANPSGTIAGSICDQLGNSVTGPATLTVTCTFAAPGTMASGATVNRYLVFRVGSAPSAGGDVYNTNATVFRNETDTNAANDSEGEATTVRVRADIGIVKTASINPAQIREPFNWSIVVTNAGPGDSQTTGLTDTLPSGMVFGVGSVTWVMSGGGSGTCSVVGLAITCAFGLLPAGQNVTVTVPARVTGYPVGGTTQNCATATTSEVDPNTANNLSVCSTLTVQHSSLAGTVFQDRDRVGANGGTPQSAATEPRISGVTVQLAGTDAYGNVVAQSTTTDAAGAFAFANLSPAGASGYTVTESQPAGFVNGPVSPPTPAATGTYAGGGSAGNSSWATIALVGNTIGVGYDFPEVRKPTLSGFVYIDLNANGVRDAGTDTAVSGATVRLLDAGTLAVVATTTTSGAGAYSFANLDPLIVYTLEEPLPASPAGLGNGAVNPGLINGAACASGCTAQSNTPVVDTDRIASIDLGAGTDGTLFNFGELQETTVSGLVFVDANRNNALDASDTGRVASVTMRLVQGADCVSGSTVQTTATAANGTYSFAGVIAFQNYLVCETQPAGYGTGSANGTPGSNVITITNLASTGSANNNFGETLAQISGSVYQDTGAGTPANFNNGARDAGEAGIVNVPVTLSGIDQFGTPVSITVLTDASGNFSFDGMFPPNGSGYTLTEGAIPVASGVFLQGRDAAGTAGGSIVVQDVTSAIGLSAGQQATGYLFGELPQSAIGGTVYIDRNLNDTLDATPTDGRIANVTLRLVTGADCTVGTTLQTTTSANDGTYSFANVAGGGNYLVCETQPAGYLNGVQNPGTSATSPSANVIAITNLPSGGSSGNHFGERIASIAGSVYQDFSAATPANSNNGVRDIGETGIVNVPVTLTGHDINGAAVNTTLLTDASGNYLFSDLLQSDATGYTVSEGAIPPASGTYADGKDTPGSLGASSAVKNQFGAVVVPAGTVATGYLFGELPVAGISGTVYVDRNRNGTMEATPTDGRLAGVTVRLLQGASCASGTVLLTTSTAADGSFSFASVAGGQNYLVCETQPAGYAQGSVTPGTNGTTPATDTILISNLAAAGSPGNLFGEQVASIAGSVYQDYTAATPANTNNGVRDSGEVGIVSVPVTLSGHDINGAAVNTTIATDASGNYLFGDLLQSDATGYTVSEGAIPPASGTFADGKDTAGTLGASTAVKNQLGAIVLPAGTVATGYLFGELPIAPIGGTVYIDRNRNGTIDATPTDGRIAGVTVTLHSGGTCAGALIATTTTDASGNYAFSGTPAGSTVTVCETQPAGYAEGSVNPGTSAASGAANAITITNLPAGGSAANNFGEQVGSLAGSVYLDYSVATPANNNNGSRDSGEPGIANVPVTLVGHDIAGATVNLATTTDASGNYLFGDLLQSDATGYMVIEGTIPPAAGTLSDGKDTAGSLGGSAAVKNRTGAVVLPAGNVATGYLFGELPSTSIAGSVYIDRNRNGTMEATPTDGRLASVTLRLLQGASCASGTVLQTTTTAADGSFSFTSVAGGQSYLVCETQPAGYAQGSVTPGTSGTTPAVDTILITNLAAGGSTGNLFGEQVGSLAGSVYLDYSAAAPANSNNGVRDAGETGIANVPITLTGHDIAGATVNLATTTDAGGNYLFSDLVQSDATGYTVVEGAIPPAAGALADGKDTAGTLGGSAAVKNQTGGIVLPAGNVATGYLFGELPNTSISGSVYLDRNRNGTMEATPTDARIAGVTVRLVQGASCASGTMLQTTTTAADGGFSFSGVSGGQNYLVCETQPVGYSQGSVAPGTNGTTPAVDTILVTNLAIAGSSGNLFGERAGSLAGNVFLDANNDGLRTGDAGIAGITITLSGADAAGTPVSRTATTDATGAWRFDDMLAAGPGGYTVTEQTAQPIVAGTTTLNGKTTAGSSGGTASAVTSAPSAIAAIALTAGADAIENNFAEILPVSLAGTVFFDLNNNGVQNLPGDTGIAGVALVLTGTDDTGTAVTRNVATIADGTYGVVNLRPGTYTVTEPTQPAGTTNGLTVAGSAGGTATTPAVTPSAIAGVALTTPATSATGYNFAEIPNTSSVSGRVWLDADNSGTINGSEAGIAGVTIDLTGTDLGGTAVARTTTTDASGNYSFANLAPGTYAVHEPTQPGATLNGTTVAGSTGGTATSVATVPSVVSGIVLGVGQSSTGNNFGELPGASIAGHVIGDSNNNGRLDAGETGIANVAIALTGTDDLGQAVSAATTTDAGGAYSFANLRPGSYTATEPTQPPGTVNGITTAGTVNGTSTGTATPTTTVPSTIAGIVLPAGAASINNDFAEIGNSPDVLVSKASVEARFTVNNVGTYTIRVRNGGEVATNAAVRVSDRLPAGLTLAAVPTGTGWNCVGAIGAASFTCTSTDVLGAGATNANAITVKVSIAATALQSSPAINAVMVDGGGELPARAPTPAETDAFNNTPATLPVCASGITQNACRTATPVQASASISGTTWYDTGATRGVLDGGDKRLVNWQVEVLDANGTIVARATTAADGSYRINDLLPGVVLHVRFRDPAANVVWGYPVNGEAATGSSGATCNTTQAIANGTASSCPGIGADPTLTVVLASGANLPQQSLPVDPSGVVYDSGTRQPVPGGVVTLAPVGTCAGWNPATGLVAETLGGFTVNGDAVSMTVGADGFYQFLFSPAAPASCAFSLAVTPPTGYHFVSALIPPTAGPFSPPGGPGATAPVQPQSGAPTGPVGPATTYYLTVTGGSATANIINNHLPLDPDAPTGLSLSKTGDKTLAEVGDSVRYTITVQRSSGPVPRQVTVVDRLPAGFTFIAGTAVVNGVSVADPFGKPGPALTFNLGPMSASGQLVLQYRIRVGVGAQQGDGINRAIGYGCGVPAGCTAGNGTTPLAGSAATNEGRFQVRIGGGVFTTEACVLGKIFVDCNGNHVQDEEEIGIPGVRLVISDGTTLISDSEGKYSYCGLPPRSHVMRVDETTLPRGSRLTTSSNRNLGDAGSLWLDLKNGELARADFIEGSCSRSVLDQVKARRAQGEIRSVETEKKSLPALKFDSKDKGPRPRTEPPAEEKTGGAP